MKGLVALLPWLVAGCPGGSGKAAPTAEAQTTADDPAIHLAHVLIELQDDILASYERDEPPELDSSMIVPAIGTARIGAGPGDVYIAGDLARAPSRWPLDVDRSTRTDVRSKNLAIQVAVDQSAAWMSDELSWRIAACGRTAVIPLRITALYAHDGDRWIPVFEHLSFGWAPTPLDAPPPKAIKTEVVSGDLRDELSGVLGRGLLRTPHDPQVAAQDPGALVLGPDAADEWHGPAVLAAKLPAGKLEDRRVGTVGRTPSEATVAYWIGNYIADIPARPGYGAGKVRMRVTHVFEKRRPGDGKLRACTGDDCRWMLVQTHMSQPISDDDLTQRIFGTALISPKPLQLDCSDSDSIKAPAAAPRPGAVPPARSQ